MAVWCCTQVLWRRWEVRLGPEPGLEPRTRTRDSAPSCEYGVGWQVHGGVRTEDGRGARVTGPTAPGTVCCLFPPQAHTLSHTCTCTHTHSCSHIILAHTPLHNTKFTHHIHTVHSQTLSMTHIHLVSRTLSQSTHTALTGSHTLLYTHTTHTQTRTNTL